MTTKETVLAVLDRLPDDCTLEDVQYHFCTLGSGKCSTTPSRFPG